MESKVYATKNELQKVLNSVNETQAQLARLIVFVTILSDKSKERFDALEEEVKCLKEHLQLEQSSKTEESPAH